jgi:flagellar biosynthesis protein FliP
VLKPGTYKLANEDGRNSPTLGTSNSYVVSTLRKDFQVSFVIYIPNTTVGCTNVNSVELIKSKGDSAFP